MNIQHGRLSHFDKIMREIRADLPKIAIETAEQVEADALRAAANDAAPSVIRPNDDFLTVSPNDYDNEFERLTAGRDDVVRRAMESI